MSQPINTTTGLLTPERAAEIDHRSPVETASADRPIEGHTRRFSSISTEMVVWVGLLLIAAITRFYDLGSRALHHDESLHTYYSWLLAEGRGYIHNPLMHGPFLFHIDALFFLLFGDSDAVSRAPAALAGVVLVGLPWLLRGRQFLGRWGAIATSVFILASPSILFYTRFIRHDPFTLVGVLLLLICIARYLDRPERRWLIAGGASIAFLLTNHEIVFANLAIFFGFLYVVLLVDRIRAWRADPARRSGANLILAAHAFAIVGTGIVLAVAPHSAIDEILEIPWQNPTNEQQFAYYERLASNPLVLGMLAVAVGFVTMMVIGLKRARSNRVDDGEPAGALLGDARAGTVAAGVRSAWRDPQGIGLALIVGFVIFAMLFTTMFTNLGGLATATFATDGTLLYWLGQHEVQRGSQPWFYYLVLMPQYEFIGFTLGIGAAIAIALKAIAIWRGTRVNDGRLLFQGMVAVWFVGILAGLSYAGEKMPWLVMHIALPAALLAGMAVGGLIERVIATRRHRAYGRPEWLLASGLVLAGTISVALASILTRPNYSRASTGAITRGVTQWANDNWWLLALPPLVSLLALVVAAFWRGPQRAALAAGSALIVGLLLLQVHAGARMSYLEGDVPRDMLIYTQTSPDVPMLARDMRELSLELEGDLTIELLYDSRVSWPLQWYLRDFTGKRMIGAGAETPTAPVLIISNEQYNQMGSQLQGYTAYEYVLRWWFPEEMYRNFAIAPELDPSRSAWGVSSNPHGPFDVVASIFESIGGHDNPDAQQELYRLLMYRELSSPIGQYRLKLMIRNDLLPVFNGIRY